MSQQIRTPKGVIITLVAGFGLGALTMAGIHSGIVIPAAFAQGTGNNIRVVTGGTTESIAELHNLDSSFSNLAEFVAPAVVDIRATSGRTMDANGQRMPVRSGEGSGFVLRSDGYILTNDHVVDGADTVKVMFKDGHEYTGKVIRAEDSDLAVVKIDAKDLPVLQFGDSANLKPGQMCMAVGSPFGMENSVTFGHVSALGRATPIASDMQERYYPDLIQTDASINMGNSGGPLVNVDGQVIGINTAIYSPSGTSAGIGFAIPSNQAKFIADMLINKGKVTRSMIGIVPENLKDYVKKEKGLEGGALVHIIQPSSPAQTAGIKENDIIVKIGTTPVNSQLDLRNSMLIYAPNTTVPVQLIRDGKTMTVNVKLEPYKKPESQMQSMPMQRGNGQNFDIPKFFDSPDMKQFKQFQDRIRQGQGDDQQDVPAIKGGQAKLGVQVGTTSSELRTQYNIPSSVSGAVVVDVQPGSVASRIGLQEGDVVTQLGDKKIATAEDLTAAMKDMKWGDSTHIKFNHYDKDAVVSQELSVTFK